MFSADPPAPFKLFRIIGEFFGGRLQLVAERGVDLYGCGVAFCRLVLARHIHRGLQVLHEFIDFIDHVSGTTNDRPQLEKLWRAVRARQVDTVLVSKFDRFARSTKHLIDALEEFKHLGVELASFCKGCFDKVFLWATPGAQRYHASETGAQQEERGGLRGGSSPFGHQR